ncbi:MAG: hypothetical protein ACRDWV_04610 [Acidimicrobiales bacterium]
MEFRSVYGHRGWCQRKDGSRWQGGLGCPRLSGLGLWSELDPVEPRLQHVEPAQDDRSISTRLLSGSDHVDLVRVELGQEQCYLVHPELVIIGNGKDLVVVEDSVFLRFTLVVRGEIMVVDRGYSLGGGTFPRHLFKRGELERLDWSD